MTDYRSQMGRPPRRWLRGARLILPLAAFLLGIAAVILVLTRWDAAADRLGLGKAEERKTAAMPAPVEILAAPPPAPVSAAEQDWTRIETIEQRLAQIENQSRAAVGNTDRAEGLLVAFAARRALDRGVTLGFLEALLTQRFGRTQPDAVATVITASRDPVTLEQLQEGLLEVAPDLSGGAPEQDWWTALKTELSDLVTIRKGGTPSTLPEARLDRAVRRVEAGQVDVALAEVLRLPGRRNAEGWIADARRYVSARRALDAIETAALLEPRMPVRLSPPSPVTAPAAGAP